MADTSGLRERFLDLYLGKPIGPGQASRARDGGGGADPGVAQAPAEFAGVRIHKGNVDPAAGKDISAIAQYDPRSQTYRVEALDGAVQFIPFHEEKTAGAMAMLQQAKAAGLQKVADQLMRYLVDLVALAPAPVMVVRHDAALVYKKPCEWTDAEWKQHYARPRGKGKPADAAMVGWAPIREGA